MGFGMEEFGSFFKRFAPMAESVLLAGGHLGKSPFMAQRNENRIVPEAGFASGLPGYGTFCVAEKSHGLAVREGHGYAADELGASFVVRDVL